MGLPVDFGEVFRIANDMKAVAEVPLAVSIIIDDTADGQLAAHVRSAFASTSAHTRVTVTYLDDGYTSHEVRDDLAVIVAGTSTNVGELAAKIRSAGVPVMVVCDDPAAVFDAAMSAGNPLAAADIVAPVKVEGALGEKVASLVPVLRSRMEHVTQVGKISLNDEAFKTLYQRMGEWIITTCPEKKLTLALAFPFVRRPLASDSISATSMQNAAIGFVPVIPGADMPIMTLNQMKMVLQIATAYGQPLDANRVKELACVLGGAFIARNIARSGAKLIPFAGWLVSGAVGFAATEAMGRAAVEYFEAGGDIVGIASVLQTARDGAMDAAVSASNTSAGRKVLDMMGSAVPAAVRAVTNKKDS